MGIAYKFFDKLQKNKTANEIIKIVRAAALAIIITSSINIFKNAFLNNIEINNINILYLINYKSIILAIGIYFFNKYKEINSILLIIISGLFAGIINL
jgi:chromate transport protein ChrA